MEEVQEDIWSCVYRGESSSDFISLALRLTPQQPNNRLVWNETVSIMNDLFTNIWGDKKEVVLDHALEITMPVSFTPAVVDAFGS